MHSVYESSVFSKMRATLRPASTGSLVACVLCRFELSREVNEEPQLIRREVKLFEEVAMAEVDGHQPRPPPRCIGDDVLRTGDGCCSEEGLHRDSLVATDVADHPLASAVMAQDLQTGTREPPASRRRSWWGWGWDDQAMTTEQCESLAAAVQDRFGRALEVRDPVRLEDVELRAPRIRPPNALAHLCSTDVSECGHTYGKSYRAVVRGLRGEYTSPRPARRAELGRPAPGVADWWVESWVEIGGQWRPDDEGADLVGVVVGRPLVRVREGAACCSPIDWWATGAFSEVDGRPCHICSKC